MGRYRGRSGKKWWHKKQKNGDSQPHQGMSEGDSVLIEKYLIEYRTNAYGLLGRTTPERSQQHSRIDARPYKIGNHVFLALTDDLCKQPYIDLPDSLSSKERKHVHALSSMLDLYHCGAGSNEETSNHVTKKRRIVVSIFANGLDYVPDLESPLNEAVFFSRKYRPWYDRALSATGGDLNSLILRNIDELQSTVSPDSKPYIIRGIAIEEEKNQMSQYTRCPEQAVRTSPRIDLSTADSDASFQQQVDTLDMHELESMDLSAVPTPNQCPWMLVDTVQKLEVCVKELMFGLDYRNANSSRIPLLHELAFDLEMYNHGGGEKKTALRTCLIQLTSNVAVKDYVIDPLAPGVWDAILVHLGPIFSDPNIVKIGHAIGSMDTTSLHRDFGICVVNAFDTYEASAVIANRRRGGLGLASLCKHYGLPSWEEYSELKHTYQTSNWSKRPLDDRAIVYGRFDVRCLILLRKLLMRDLVKMDMIGGKNPFGYMNRTRSATDSTQTSSAETNSTSESVTESSSSYNLSSSNDPYSQQSSFDEFKDASTSDSPKSDNGSTDDFVDAKEVSSPANKSDLVLHASDLPPFHHLMQAIKISNKRCLSLWTRDNEEHVTNNPKLLAFIEQSITGKGQGRFWSDKHYQLYMAMARWRNSVAEREGIEAFEVCSIDFLLYVAYKLPLNCLEMRRFAHFLPQLVTDGLYFEELLELITSSDAFGLMSKTPLSDIERFEVVFYRDATKKRRADLLKAFAAALTLGVVSIIMVRSGRKK